MIEEKVRNVIEKPINDIGITVKEIKYEKENGTMYKYRWLC